jgi:hypothetical protein
MRLKNFIKLYIYHTNAVDMNLKKSLYLTITPTYLAVMEKHSPEEVDSVLRKSFPDAFDTESSTLADKKTLLERINSFKPHKPAIGIDEALLQTREEEPLLIRGNSGKLWKIIA